MKIDGRRSGVSFGSRLTWPQRMAPERYDRRLFGHGQDGRPRFPRPGLHVLDCRPLAPLRHRLGVDAQFPTRLRERSLRSLYCSSDGVRGRGAAMTNLSQSASFHSCERIAPSNRGIKHLSRIRVRQRGWVCGGSYRCLRPVAAEMPCGRPPLLRADAKSRAVSFDPVGFAGSSEGRSCPCRPRFRRSGGNR